MLSNLKYMPYKADLGESTHLAMIGHEISMAGKKNIYLKKKKPFVQH